MLGLGRATQSLRTGNLTQICPHVMLMVFNRRHWLAQAHGCCAAKLVLP